jgi:hypothetical protein
MRSQALRVDSQHGRKAIREVDIVHDTPFQRGARLIQDFEGRRDFLLSSVA